MNYEITNSLIKLQKAKNFLITGYFVSYFMLIISFWIAALKSLKRAHKIR